MCYTSKFLLDRVHSVFNGSVNPSKIQILALLMFLKTKLEIGRLYSVPVGFGNVLHPT